MHRQFEAHRRHAFCAGIGLCAAAAFLAPLAGRSSLALSAGETPFARRFALPPRVNAQAQQLRNVRDPFASEDVPGEQPKQPVKREGPIVRAIISGPSPRALVEDGGHLRIVEVGDRLGGAAIEAIAGGRVILTGGQTLVLAGGSN